MADRSHKRSKAILESLMMMNVCPNTVTELIGPALAKQGLSYVAAEREEYTP
jgi:hypothetical protein